MYREDVQKDPHAWNKKIILCLLQMAKKSFGIN